MKFLHQRYFNEKIKTLRATLKIKYTQWEPENYGIGRQLLETCYGFK